MALPAFYLYVVAEHYFQIVQTSFAKRKPTSAQAIAYYIKKSTLNVDHHTSAESGTQGEFDVGRQDTGYGQKRPFFSLQYDI